MAGRFDTRPDSFLATTRGLSSECVALLVETSRFAWKAALRREILRGAMSEHAGLDKRRDVKLAWEAINARDFDRLAELLHPHGEFRSVVGQTEGEEVYIGIAGLRKWAENIDATWEDFRSDPVDYHDAGEERAVVVARVTGRAKVSGVPLDVILTQLLTWREGKLWRNETFADRPEALKAAGLSE